jgi:glyoxylase-like metal-dependent hydrolase (beta-lactamase superfamily II)
MAEREPLVFDLGWLGRPGLIGAWRSGDLLVDCGPSTCLEALLAACGEWRPKALLLTHIHFDHAGAAGQLTARWPDLEVWVHRRGARHLAAPERLEASARRVFGEDFDRRFGPMRPVPAENIHPLDGGETVHGMVAEATPGHAKHHLAFFAEDGSAYAGDVAGVRLGIGEPVQLPAPPPDIDLDGWDASLRLIAERRPERLLLPHFGEFDDPDSHLDAVRGELVRQRELAGYESAARYVTEMRDHIARSAAAERRDDYELVVPLEQNHVGLRRWTGAQRDAMV